MLIQYIGSELLADGSLAISVEVSIVSGSVVNKDSTQVKFTAAQLAAALDVNGNIPEAEIVRRLKAEIRDKRAAGVAVTGVFVILPRVRVMGTA